MLDHPVVAIEDGRIASISTRSAGDAPGVARVLDFPGATLAPAFFDVHIHGGAGHDVMEATPEALNADEQLSRLAWDGQLSGDNGYRAHGCDVARAFRAGKAAGRAAG